MAAGKKRPRRRREKGSGSVYQLANGRWQAALEIDGRVIRRNTLDRDAAQAALEDLQTLKRAGVDLGAAAQPLAQWLQAWHRQAARDLSPRAAADYQAQITTYVLPTLGNLPLNEIRAHHLQALINGIVDDIAANTRYAGTRTARLVAVRLDQAFDLAVKRNLILSNPMRGVVLPRDTPAAIEPPSEEQIAAFLVVAIDHPLAALWHLYALLGLRRGEGLGLTWADVELDAATVRIRQQVQAIPGTSGKTSTICIGAPKSAAGLRTLPIPAIVVDLLRARRAAQLVLRVKRADSWHDQDLVFCNRDGGPLWPAKVSKIYYALRAEAGLPNTIKLHHFRHAVATLLDENGATEALKAGILGHGKRGVTQHYTHARLAAMRAVVERVAEKVARRVG